MKKQNFIDNPHFQIHIAVFLWGFTAILGKLIEVSAIPLVLGRMMIAGIVYLLIPSTIKEISKLSFTTIKKLSFIGVVIAVHWLCFYYSVKVYDSASVVLICLGTGPIMILWIEYFAYRKKPKSIQIFISLLAILGIVVLSMSYENFRIEYSQTDFYLAIVFGLLASLFAACFTIMNKKMTATVKPMIMACIELLSGGIAILLYSAIFYTASFTELYSMTQMDIFYLLVLAIICTNVPFLLSIFSLKKLDPFYLTLTVNLEPIYGIVFAIILFKEYNFFNSYFYIGAFLVLISVFIPMIVKKRNS